MDIRRRTHALLAQGVMTAGQLAVVAGDAEDECAYQVRVLGGPLRGARLCMPHLERPSYVTGRYEPHVVAALQRYAQPGMVAYDIGAHIGYMALMLSQMVGPSGHVVAFEASPTNYQALSHNIAVNNAENIRAVAHAVSDVSGVVTFAAFDTYSTVGHIATDATPHDATLLEVPAVSLDDFTMRNDPAPYVMLIDVEGAEARVLQGATRVLREARPVVICEVRDTETWPQIDMFMRTLGYRADQLAPWTEGVTDILFIPLA